MLSLSKCRNTNEADKSTRPGTPVAIGAAIKDPKKLFNSGTRGVRLTRVWSLHVTRNWRLTFRIEEDEIVDVDYEDYH